MLARKSISNQQIRIKKSIPVLPETARRHKAPALSLLLREKLSSQRVQATAFLEVLMMFLFAGSPKHLPKLRTAKSKMLDQNVRDFIFVFLL